MFAPFPPSSSCTRFNVAPAIWATRRPTAVDPVKAILFTSGCSASAWPAELPNPGMTLTTPGGKPTSLMSSAIFRLDSGVSSAGFNTTQLPAASAGASFQVAIRIGKFHGMICPTTPSGSWK